MLAASAASFGQTKPAPPKDPPAIPMPVNRAADSYQIYSSLMPLGETAFPSWPHEYWLVRDTTITAVPPDQPCKLEPSGFSTQSGFDMNPHIAIHPPNDRKQDFQEILDDFDAHCHERVQLDPTAFNTPVPVHLLNALEQQQFVQTRHTNSPIADRYKGAPALYSFSEVYFNQHQTVALVYATHWCGSLCGQGFWIALALENGKWKQLNWNATTWIS
jgi:hypothetical protein